MIRDLSKEKRILKELEDILRYMKILSMFKQKYHQDKMLKKYIHNSLMTTYLYGKADVYEHYSSK